MASPGPAKPAAAKPDGIGVGLASRSGVSAKLNPGYDFIRDASGFRALLDKLGLRGGMSQIRLIF